MFVVCAVLCCRAAVGFPIKGTVVDTDGKPVAGIKVVAIDCDRRPPAIKETVTADANGAFVFKTIDVKPPVKVTGFHLFALAAVEPGARIGWRSVVLGYPLGNPRNDELAKGVKITIAAPESVEGKVTNEAGDPVADAKVEARWFVAKNKDRGSTDLSMVAKYIKPVVEFTPAFTGKDGTYRLQGIPANVTPTVVVSKADLAMKPVAYGTPPSLDVVMVPGGACAGRVVDEKGKGIAGAFVSMVSSGLSDRPSGRGDAISGLDGSFVVDGLVPDAYRLMVYDARRDYITLERGGIKVKAAETTKLPDIVSPPAAYVTGRVLDTDTGKPIPKAEIGAGSGQFAGPRVTSDKQGNYKIAVLSGDVRIYYAGGNPMYMVDWRATRKPVTVPPAGLKGHDIKLRCSGQCRGIVVGPDGKPLANSIVSIGSRPEGVQATTDAKGAFALGLPPNVDLSGG